MCLALSNCVLFISLMQPVNGAQFFNTTFLLALFGLSPACAAINVVPLTSHYNDINLTLTLEF